MLLKHFKGSILVTILGLVALFWYGSWEALFIAVLLVLLEVTLSFDNAVVNARVLEKMTPTWQRRFLTWGILLAVFVTRFVLPIVIVSLVTLSSPWLIMQMALFDAHHYGELLEGAKYAIHGFGASFLLLVALKYFLDKKKELHWINIIEKRLIKWGRIESVEIVLVLLAITSIAFLVPQEVKATVMMAGVFGIILFIFMQGLTNTFSVETNQMTTNCLALFLYLEILDASFSLDGVIGAFALTSSILIIAIGLGIGAFFVRSLTIFMVREKTLDKLKYLEHGAHWAIFGLAISMLVSMLTEVPELITGTVGVSFVLAAYYSSLRHRKSA
ncbi:DUF475 domain-containing protein [Candidatus Kaiserbacteria bacterium]|nr:DUF475 domain-containing protein [Candidatus Kaiserbacteria bacterium]USN91950.1 MAG: DUF475 domain-containing protein [Candidatus Nomurabacteria bacterium]